MGKMIGFFFGALALVCLGIGLVAYVYGVGPGVGGYELCVALGALFLAVAFLALGWKEELIPLAFAAIAFDRSRLFWVFLCILIVMLYLRAVEHFKVPDKSPFELPQR